MLDTKFRRFNGDIGNAQTWPFPVQYKIVHGAVPNKVVDLLTTATCSSASPTRRMS